MKKCITVEVKKKKMYVCLSAVRTFKTLKYKKKKKIRELKSQLGCINSQLQECKWRREAEASVEVTRAERI